MLRMIVEGVGFDHLRQTVVVLKDWEGQKLLPIWIGASEAKSIALELEGTEPPRPLSHDLLLNCINLAGGRITRVVINDLQESTFFATIDVDTSNGMKHIDARPSDAIAVAVRAKCPVFVDGGAMEALIEMVDGGQQPGSVIEGQDASVNSEGEQILEEQHAPAGGDGPPDEEIDRFRRLIGDLEV